MRDELSTLDDRDITYFTGMPRLDQLTEGFTPGELIVISGPTKHGKTLLAQSLTRAFERRNVFSLWFSYEVTPKNFLRAFGNELPVFYLPRTLKMNALDWVMGKCSESAKDHNTRVVFIDHLHYLFDIAKSRSPSIEIGTVIRKLKTLAVSQGLVVFLLCHTTKGASDPNTSYESIRDSSFVAQESDCVMMIRRGLDEPQSNRARLRIEFHRRTGVLNELINLVKVDKEGAHYLAEEDRGF
jgi:replicative DNA helicase